MTTVIYADVLFFLNMISDFLILYLTGMFSGNGISLRRSAVCAAFGAVLGTVILCMNTPGIATAAITVVLPLVLCFFAFGKKSLPAFACLIFYFYLSSVLLFGGMYAFASVLQTAFGRNALSKRAVVAVFLMIAVTLIYFIYSAICERGFRRHENLVRAEISDGIKTYSLKLLVDSGNLAKDPFSQRPVTIISESSLAPELVGAVCDSEGYPSYGSIKPRVIPVKTISGTCLLYAFIPESMYIFTNRKKIKANCIIAIDRRNNPFFGKDGIISENLLKTL